MITDPRFAPKRADLSWLRRRRMPKAPAAAAQPLTEFLSGHTHGEHHRQHAAPAPPAPVPSRPVTSSSLDLDQPPAAAPARAPSRPVTSSSLDLDQPPAAAPAPSPPVTSSLDLDQPPAAAPSRPVTSSSLDLDDAPAPAPRPAAPRASAGRVFTPARVRAGERVILTPTDPAVTLTRLQSGIGALTIEAAASAEVGDLRLGCAYELASDLETTMQMTQGSRLAPPHSKRPILLGSRDRFEKVSVDLRQCRSLRRMIVYGFSEGRQPINWGGTLVVTTFGAGRIELPLESLREGDIGVLLSIYQVRGEFVLRAEMQTLYGDVREACRAYGYDKITWLDDRTPVS